MGYDCFVNITKRNEGNNNMIIDDKGRIFGKMSLIDLTLLAFFVLFFFILIQFLIIKPDYFHYENVSVEFKFNNQFLKDIDEVINFFGNETINLISVDCFYSSNYQDSVTPDYIDNTIGLNENKSDCLENDCLCNIVMIFNTETRIIDSVPTYNTYEYPLIEGNYIKLESPETMIFGRVGKIISRGNKND